MYIVWYSRSMERLCYLRCYFMAILSYVRVSAIKQSHLSPSSIFARRQDTLKITLVRLGFDVALASNTTSDPFPSSIVDKCPHKNKLGMLHFTH